jgi:hypothetical protein
MALATKALTSSAAQVDAAVAKAETAVQPEDLTEFVPTFSAEGKMWVGGSGGTTTEIDSTTAGRALLTGDLAAQKAALGVAQPETLGAALVAAGDGTIGEVQVLAAMIRNLSVLVASIYPEGYRQ